MHISLFDKYFYKKKELKLSYGDRVIILNNFLYVYNLLMGQDNY